MKSDLWFLDLTDEQIAQMRASLKGGPKKAVAPAAKKVVAPAPVPKAKKGGKPSSLRKVTAEEAEAILLELEATGETVRSYSARNRINGRSLCCFKSNKERFGNVRGLVSAETPTPQPEPMPEAPKGDAEALMAEGIRMAFDGLLKIEQAFYAGAKVGGAK
jgi:hypothetical protein